MVKTRDWGHEMTPTQLTRLPQDIGPLQSVQPRGGRVHQSLSIQHLQYVGPKQLPPIDRQTQDRVNLHQDLLPDVLIDPTLQAGVHEARVQKNGKAFLKIDLDTFRLNFLSIIMGHNMELVFMVCYLLLGMCIMHLLLLRSNNLSLSILGRLL